MGAEVPPSTWKESIRGKAVMETRNSVQTPRSSLVRRLEIATNIAVLIAALLSATFFVRLFVGRYNPSDAPHRSSPGTRLALPGGYDFASHDRTLILAVQEDCSYCEASMPFYREVADRMNLTCSQHGLVAVLPNQPPSSGRRFARAVWT